jgi:hypothetical protein
MSGPKHILPNPETRLKRFHFVFLAFSLLFLSAAVFLWILLIKDQIARENAFGRLPFVLYMLLMTMALIFASLTIMARTGARWSHVSYFLVYLPVPSTLIPIVGTVLCGYCLKKMAGPELPELKFSRKSNRHGYRPPDMNPWIYKKVPLHKSNVPGMAALAFIIATHAVYIIMSIVYAVAD